MPVTNIPNTNTNPAKYILYYSKTFDGVYKRSYRTIIQSFRTQMKGLGAGSAIYLPQEQLNSDIDAENLEIGMFIKILDGTVFWEDEYGSVGDELFIGTIDSITNDVFQGKTDRQGTIVFSEIGQYLSTQPLIWGEKKQIFNPIIEGRCFGNKKEDENEFETKVSDMETTDANSKFQPTDSNDSINTNKRVWSLNNVLDYLSSKYSFDIVYPWIIEKRFYEKERDTKLQAYKILPGDSPEVQQQKQDKIDEINEQHNSDMQLRENAYQYFKNSVDVRSYDNFDGKNLPQMMNELLEEPFTWRIKYVSTSAPTIEIINKSVVEIPGICPAGYKQKRNLDNSIIANFNITEDAEVYDQIVYRGNNILFCGTITPWIFAQGQSVDPDWSSGEEFSWIRGGQGKDAANEKEATTFRDTLPNVYRKFKFKYYDEDCYFRIVKKLKNDGTYEQAPFFVWESGGGVSMVPFFERVDFTKTEDGFTYVLPEPKLYDSLTLHKSPPKLQFKWADKLPFETQQGKLKEPFVIATNSTRTEDGGVTNRTIFFTDLTKPGGGYDTCGIKFNTDGYTLEMNTPETLGSNEDILFEVGESIPRRTKSEWEESYPSSRNPLTTDYKYMTSWESLALTVAAYSDQQLEYIITKPGTTIVKKKKIIEDPSLECHIVHAGTIKKLREGTFEVGNPNSLRPVLYNGFERFERDTFVRNDFSKLKQYADQAAQWLFIEKRAVRIENHLQLYPSGSWNVGDLIGSIKDEDIVHNINSAVESVEYDAVMNRVRISTAIPIMPELKRLRQQPISQGNIAPVTDTKAPRINATQKIITLEEQPTIGYAIGGTSEASTDPGLYQVIYGEVNNTTGVVRVKWINGDVPESIPAIPDLKNYTNPVTGFGVAVNLITGNVVLISNHKQKSKAFYDIPIGTLCYLGSVESIVTITDDISGSQNYYPIIWAN